MNFFTASSLKSSLMWSSKEEFKQLALEIMSLVIQQLQQYNLKSIRLRQYSLLSAY